MNQIIENYSYTYYNVYNICFFVQLLGVGREMGTSCLLK